MNAPQRTSYVFHPPGLLALLGAIAIILLPLLALPATTYADPGAIWTTRADCGSEQQNVNDYDIGETVYVTGHKFQPGTYQWQVEGLPGQASLDPGLVIATGSIDVGEAGTFCFAAYIVASDDGGEYKVTVGGKHDNYRVTPAAPTEVPVLTPAPTKEGPGPPAPPTQTPEPPAPPTQTWTPTATQTAIIAPPPPPPTQTPEPPAPTQTPIIAPPPPPPTQTPIVIVVTQTPEPPAPTQTPIIAPPPPPPTQTPIIIIIAPPATETPLPLVPTATPDLVLVPTAEPTPTETLVIIAPPAPTEAAPPLLPVTGLNVWKPVAGLNDWTSVLALSMIGLGLGALTLSAWLQRRKSGR